MVASLRLPLFPLLLLLQINAMANKAAGKGYESTDFYENVKFQFVGIENIHVMRQSLQKMMECEYNVYDHDKSETQLMVNYPQCDVQLKGWERNQPINAFQIAFCHFSSDSL